MDSGFTRASEYSPIPPQTDPDIIQWQEAIVERLDALQESSTSSDIERRLKELERKMAGIATLKPEERQAIRETINDLLTETQSLRAGSDTQARRIELLQDLAREQSEQMVLLRDVIMRLQKQLEDLEYRVGLDIALDRQRITKLEAPPQPQPKQKDRADTLRLLLAANNGKMLAKDARHRLGLSEPQFSQLLKTLKGLVEVRPLHTDGRQHVITLVKALTKDGT
jgi:hypothetical protein